VQKAQDSKRLPIGVPQSETSAAALQLAVHGNQETHARAVEHPQVREIHHDCGILGPVHDGLGCRTKGADRHAVELARNVQDGGVSFAVGAVLHRRLPFRGDRSSDSRTLDQPNKIRKKRDFFRTALAPAPACRLYASLFDLQPSGDNDPRS
jgi:hypothetical protein